MDFTRIDIKPHQVTPLLATPRTLALLFAGAATYIGFIDPNVRNSINSVRQRLRQWALMYVPSMKIMGGLALVTAAFGISSYVQTKVNLWLVGSALMASLWPFTMFCLDPTNKYLLDLDSTTDAKTQLEQKQRISVLDKLNFWVNGHRVRVLISILAIGTFYLAQLKSTQDVNVGVIMS